MSYFYGSLQGSRGPITRSGTKISGIKASIESNAGSVAVEMRELKGVNYVTISVEEESGIRGFVLWNGRLSGLLNSSGLKP